MRSNPDVRMLIASIVIVLGSAGFAGAQLSDSAVDCRTSIAKNHAKLMKTAHKTIASCHKSRDGGKKVPDTTDCNDMSQADSPKLKFSNARTKAETAIGTACAGEDATLTSLGSPPYYSSCPVACAGVPDPMTSMSQVASCFGCYAEALAEEAGATVLGLPTPASLTKDDIKCRSAVAKGYGKYAATAYKEETSCQKDQDNLGNHDPGGCVDSDGKGKVGGALLKADFGLDKRCPAATLASLDTCATDSIANLKTCAAAGFAAVEDDAFLGTYEMGQAPFCPSTVSLTQLAGCSTLEATAGGCTSGGETTSSSSQGWRSNGHDHDVVDAVTLALDVTCPGAPGACGTCTVDGISPSTPLYDGHARCINSPWIECAALFAGDPACGGGTCGYFAGPPVPAMAGGVPLCGVEIYDEPLSGNVDPDTGSISLAMTIRSRLSSGLSISTPCPVCRGDVTPQDGTADGTCAGGQRDGQACDVQGFDLTFAASAPSDGLSLDCPPFNGASLTGGGYLRSSTLMTGAVSLPAGDTCDAPFGALDCFCGACSLDNTVVCTSDSDCSGLGVGTCEPGLTGSSRLPNVCGDFTCEAVGGPGDRGECSGELDFYCDGFLRTDGRGILPCAIDNDCDLWVTGSPNPEDWVCPNDDCGTCALGETPSCFLDPISLTGTPSTTAPVLVAATCVPPTANTGVNSAFGLPGPATTITETLLELVP